MVELQQLKKSLNLIKEINFGLEVRIFGVSLGSVSNSNSHHLSSTHCIRCWAKCFSCIISFDSFHTSKRRVLLYLLHQM